MQVIDIKEELEINLAVDIDNTTNITGYNGYDPHLHKSEEYPLVWIYFSPIILCLGVLGNTLTFLVMMRPRMRGTTTQVYLQWLAVADTLALLTRIGPEFFSAVGLFSFSELNRWTCRLEKFFFYTASDVAIWILVAFTIDRFLVVCFPLARHTAVGRPRRARLACLLILLLASAKNLHVFWTRGPVWDTSDTLQTVCGRPDAYFFFEQYIRPWLAFVLISVVPFCIILTCNIIIVKTLLRARYKRKTTIARLVVTQQSYMRQRSRASVTSTTARSVKGHTGSAASNGIFTQTTLMALSASAAFVLCVSPSIILTVGRFRWSQEPHRQAYYISRAITHQLSCLNHAINFFLYCLSGQKFRRELLVMLRIRKASLHYTRTTWTSSTSNIRHLPRSPCSPHNVDTIRFPVQGTLVEKDND